MKTREQPAVAIHLSTEAMLLDRHDVARMLHVAESTVRTLEKGGFPRPIRITTGSSSTALWRIEDVKRWIDEKYEEAR